MPSLEIHLFGPGVLTVNGQPIRPHSLKAMALLAFLAVESERAHSRAKLAALLWGEATEPAARQSLRQALYSLRTLGVGSLHDSLNVDPDNARFRPRPEVFVDVARFVTCVSSADVGAWRKAATLYRAPFLEGLRLDDCSEYEAWLTGARERLKSLAVQNLDRLVLESMAQTDWDTAQQYGEALRALTPSREATSRHLLRIFAATANAAAIETEWSRLMRVLHSELGVGPSQQTVALYRSLRPTGSASAGEFSAEASSALTSSAGRTALRDTRAVTSLVRAARAAERVYAFGAALDLYERALVILGQSPPTAVCEVLLLKEAVLDRLGRRAEQRATIEQALALARALDDPAQMAATLLRKAGACAYLCEILVAQKAGEQALEIYHTLRDGPGEAEALRELSFVHWHAENYGEALRYARKALGLHRRVGDVAGEASALHNLAEIYRDIGGLSQALEFYGRALQLHWAAENREGEILTLFGMAGVLQRAGDVDGSREKFQSALNLSERCGERTMQSRALHALALQSRSKGDFHDALRFMQRAIEIDRTINYAHALGHDLVELAAIHLLRGERAEASASLQEALVWFAFTEDNAALASANLQLTELEAGAEPTLVASRSPGWVKSHLPLAEGKVYCEFESPMAMARRM